VISRGVLRGVNYSSPLVRYRALRVRKLVEVLCDTSPELGDTVFVNTYYSLYLPAPIVDENAPNDSSRLIVETILNSSKGQKIRAKTVLDTTLSTIGSAILLSEYLKSLSLLPKSVKSDSAPIDRIRSAIERAVESTSREIERVKNVKAVVEGLEPGTISIFSTEDYGLDLIRLARNADVSAILKYLRGVSTEDLGVHRDYVPSKRGEKMGFELGFDLERLAPRSLAYPDDLFYTRLAQRKLLLYTKMAKRRPGGLYVLVDKSGSMSGEKMTWAKAVTLALYMKALRSRREFSVGFFDSQPHGLHSVGRRPRSSEVVALFEYIARVKSSGGTDITRALLTVLQVISAKSTEHNTVVLLTDGLDRVIEKPVKLMLSKTKTKLVVVMVMGENKSLEKIADSYLKVVKLDRDNILKVVGAV
jgi:uncharacterized protein with von Willebrand factor type A (vWA) domain